MITNIKKGNTIIPFGKSAKRDFGFKLEEMKNLLITGSTGSGKSELLHSLILSLISQKSPDEIQLILIDSKNLEFSQYSELSCLKNPIISKVEDALSIFKFLLDEIKEREKSPMDLENKLVVILDEFADYGLGELGKKMNQLIFPC